MSDFYPGALFFKLGALFFKTGREIWDNYLKIIDKNETLDKTYVTFLIRIRLQWDQNHLIDNLSEPNIC